MENEKTKSVSILSYESEIKNKNLLKGSDLSKTKKFKKPIIFTLMGVVFLGCIYLLFKPSSDKQAVEEKGFNDIVPRAKVSDLESDKQKAYEQALFEEKKQANKNTMSSLSNYFSEEQEADRPSNRSTENINSPYQGSTTQVLSTYQNAQKTLNSFYKEDRNYEAESLKKEVAMLKRELLEKEAKPVNTMQDQIMLMEKSYEMASRYFPSVKPGEKDVQKEKYIDSLSKKDYKQTTTFQPLLKAQSNLISSLYRDLNDETLLANSNNKQSIRFFSSKAEDQNIWTRNSIGACIHRSQRVSRGDVVLIRLLEPASIAGLDIPKGHLLTASVKFQANRLQLLISSIEYKGTIIPTDIIVYDTDGQEGLFFFDSEEKHALKEIVSNMSTNSGTSITLSSTAGQQIASDLSKSLIQGLSGYFSKKVKTPKIMLNSGYKVFLVSKK